LKLCANLQGTSKEKKEKKKKKSVGLSPEKKQNLGEPIRLQRFAVRPEKIYISLKREKKRKDEQTKRKNE